MAPQLDSGTFRIISGTAGNPPIGINLTLPAFQFARIKGHVKEWVFRRDHDGKYRLSIGGYPYTGVIDKKVAVSMEREDEVAWVITHREHHNTYTIALANDPDLGWTVSNSDDSEVEIRPIVQTRSLPPQFSPTQLFALKKSE